MADGTPDHPPDGVHAASASKGPTPLAATLLAQQTCAKAEALGRKTDHGRRIKDGVL